MDLPPNGFTVSIWPQNGQTGPSGQRVASSSSRAASSFVKAGLLRSLMARLPYALDHGTVRSVSQVYSCQKGAAARLSSRVATGAITAALQTLLGYGAGGPSTGLVRMLKVMQTSDGNDGGLPRTLF